MGKIYTYDPSCYSFILYGIPLKDFAGDEFATLEYESDAWTDELGVMGNVVRTKSLDRRATLSITMMPICTDNKLLSAIFHGDYNAPNGLGVSPLLIRDLEGVTVISASQAWIMGMPAPSFGSKLNNKTWKIRIADITVFLG